MGGHVIVSRERVAVYRATATRAADEDARDAGDGERCDDRPFDAAPVEPYAESDDRVDDSDGHRGADGVGHAQTEDEGGNDDEPAADTEESGEHPDGNAGRGDADPRSRSFRRPPPVRHPASR